MGERVLHGLIQKAKLDAEALKHRMFINSGGEIFRNTPEGWKSDGSKLPDRWDREDFLMAQLSQEEV